MSPPGLAGLRTETIRSASGGAGPHAIFLRHQIDHQRIVIGGIARRWLVLAPVVLVAGVQRPDHLEGVWRDFRIYVRVEHDVVNHPVGLVGAKQVAGPSLSRPSMIVGVDEAGILCRPRSTDQMGRH